MITTWYYGARHGSDQTIKSTIRDNNYKTVDVGASIYNWSWPEAKYVVDILPYPHKEHVSDIHHFNLNLDNEIEHTPLLEYVNEYGKFDYSICSHTLEDLMFPIQTINLLSKISNKGVIIVPSKYNEFQYHRSDKWRGEAHHKQFFDMIDNKLCLFPKFLFTEKHDNSDILAAEKYFPLEDLVIFWENQIPYTYFNEGRIDTSDNNLIANYYNTLLKEI